MVALYVNSRMVCGFFLSWWGGPPQSFERSTWDCIGLYMIHTFLDPSVASQLESFLSLIISFLGQLQYNLLPSPIVTSSQVWVSTPLPLLLCYFSGLGPEGLWHNCTIPVVSPGTTWGWPLRLLRGNSAYKNLTCKAQQPKCCLYKTPYYVTAPVRETGDVIAHLQEPELFLVHK